MDDGNNGVIVSYLDIEVSGDPHLPTVTSRLRVQRIDSSGNFLWGAKGVRVSLSETNQGDQSIVTNEQGSCIVAWRDTMNELRLQKLDEFGTRLWGDSGMFFASDGGGRPLVIPDSKGGIIINWRYQKIQRINNAGQKLWSDTGITVHGGAIGSGDGYGGALLAGMEWIDYNNGDPYWKATCQRIDSNGTALWGADGITLEDSLQNILTNPPGITLTRNGDGGATFAWQKRVRTNTLRSFTQRIGANGMFLFPDSALAVSAIDSFGNGTWSILTSLNDSKIYVLADGRPNKCLVGQRIDASGNRLWNTGDVVISSRSLGYLKATTDGGGGLIIVGFDQSDFSIRAQQCSKNGTLAQVVTEVKNENKLQVPLSVKLYQNFPNPFNPTTVISFQLTVSSFVTLKVYNTLGQEVAILVNGIQEKGERTVKFDASHLPSGVYFYRLQAGGYTASKKMLLMK